MTRTVGASIEIANLLGRRLMRDWELSIEDMQNLLNMSKEQYLDLLAEAYDFNDPAVNHRMNRVIQIRERLFGLFRDHPTELRFLNRRHPLIDGKSPMELMLDRKPESMTKAFEFVIITCEMD